MKVRYLDESQAFMQLDGCGVVGVDAGDHDVLLHGRCLIHEFDHQQPANTPTAAVDPNMNAVFDAVLIARRRAKFAKSAKSGDARCIFGNNKRKAPGALGIEPGGAVLRREFDLPVDGGRGANHFVVDL